MEQLSREALETRSAVKGAILMSLRTMFTKGFKKWHLERQENGERSVFADAFREKPLSLKRGSKDLRRRFFYFAAVQVAFKRFIIDLEKAELWLTEEDEYAIPQNGIFREETEKAYDSLFGEEKEVSA